MIGITIKENIGIGDALQFSSLPENYFRATGKKLFDISRPWFFDFNPYVTREKVQLTEVRELWNFPQVEPWANPRVDKDDPAVYLSNAEVTAARFKVPVVLNRPRLYQFEEFPFDERELVLLQTHGRSHGELPAQIIEHVLRKYRHTDLYHIGLPSDPGIGIPKLRTETLWDLAELISRARMVIGPDSGPAWIAACYPDVIVKKVRLLTVHGQKEMKDWIPLEIGNIHSHWDDRCHQIYNPSEDDVGFMPSYKRI